MREKKSRKIPKKNAWHMHKLQLAFAIVLTLCCGNGAFAQHPVSINLQKVPFKEALNRVAQKAGLSVIYNTKDAKQLGTVSLKVNHQSIQEILKTLTKDTGLSYQITEDHIILQSKKQASKQAAKQVEIKGSVVDKNNEPLIGVSVLVEGTSQGVITDFEGHFNLQVSIGKVVKISYVGYKTQRITISHQRSLNIVLEEDTKQLDEVVVTALGIKRQEKALSYNVQEVKADELTKVKDANFMNSLSGKVAGVNINASSSGTGGATRVVMRGTKSISANNNALYVIDGVPIFNTNGGNVELGEYSTQPEGEGISDLNPDDIASISVLSGPAAAALYGSNAAQGVILITTKKGKEGKVKISISNSTTFTNPLVMPEFQNTYANKPNVFRSWGNKMETPSSFEPNHFFNTGSNIQNTVSMTVGNASNQTYLSVGSTNAAGIITNNKYNRYNFTFRNTTSLLNDKMKIDFGLSYIIQNNQNLMAQGQYYNPLLGVYLYPRGENFDDVRVFERYNEGRNIYTQHWIWGDQGLGLQNPYWIAKRNVYGTKRNRYMMNIGLSYDLAKGINVASRVRVDNSIERFTFKKYASTAQLFAGPKGAYAKKTSENKQFYSDLLLNIDKRFNDFSLSANIGGSATYLKFDEHGFQGALKDMPNVFNLYNIDFKNGRDTYPLEEGYEHTTFSAFASGELGWKSQLYLTLTARNDWDSSLAQTEQSSFFYYSLGTSVILSEMFELPASITYLKARGSFASVGSPIPVGISQPRYSWEPSTGQWQTIKSRPLGKLYPERTDSWEAGITAKFFENKVSLDATYYLSNTRNQTFTALVSASSGYSDIKVQSGNVQNQGLELSLGLHNKWSDFAWDSFITYSFNKNKVVELVDNYYDALSGKTFNISQSSQGGMGSLEYILKKGGTMGDLYTSTDFKRDQEGNIWIDPATNNVVKKQLNTPKKLGSVLPDGNLGWRNDFAYKGWRFGFLVSARFGGIVASPTQAVLDQFGVSQSSADARNAGGIHVNNGYIDAEKYYDVVGGKTGILSEYIYDATNVRLQEASLSYSLPMKWFKNTCNVSLSLVGRNLLMLYAKAPFDPESTASTGTYYQGMDFFIQPSLRSYGFNVKIQF
jgi:TonB-linked SusC/RagA family outer membrane protein